MYRLNEVKNAQRVEEITVGNTVTTYVGNAKAGSAESAAVWQIYKVVQVTSGGTVTTSVTFPNGDHSYGFAWDGRAGYTYA